MQAQEQAGPARTLTIRPALRVALNAHVLEGRTIAEAAEIAGLQYESVQKALRKPHVRDEVTRLRRARLEGLTERAWFTVADLANNAVSEDVKLKASRVILEAAGELGANRRDERPANPALIQIVMSGAAQVQTLSAERPGVFEAEPFKLPHRLPEADHEPA